MHMSCIKLNPDKRVNSTITLFNYIIYVFHKNDKLTCTKIILFHLLKDLLFFLEKSIRDAKAILNTALRQLAYHKVHTSLNESLTKLLRETS